MKILGENGIGKFLKVFLQICFWGGIVLLIALPLIAQIAKVHLNASIYVIYPNGIVLLVMVFMIILFIGVAIAFYILSELIKQATEYKNENDLTI